MDERLRDLLRRFEAEPSPALAEELVREHARLGEHAPPRVLRRTPRWQPLTDFVARWFERPLTDEDGCTPEELVAAEARLGGRLPASLAEWFLLVDRRLEDVQDSPVRLDLVAVDDDGQLPVWLENQGVWGIRVRADTADDDPAIEPDEEFPISGRLVETLLSMVTSDTLVGAWSGDHRGPLGPLSAHVQGGYMHEGRAALEALGLAALPGPGNPHFQDDASATLGDTCTVVRLGGSSVEWMTATAEAYARVSRALGLEAS